MSTGKTIAIILAACVGAGLLLIATCGGLFYLNYKNVDKSISPQVDQLLAATASGRFADTYETATSSELRQVMTKEQYVAMGDAIAKNLGKLETKTLTGFKVGAHNTTAYSEATYRGIFEHGIATISVTMKQEDGQWKFMRFHVTSPNFAPERGSWPVESSEPNSEMPEAEATDSLGSTEESEWSEATLAE